MNVASTVIQYIVMFFYLFSKESEIKTRQ